jgi:hypothetical protein
MTVPEERCRAPPFPRHTGEMRVRKAIHALCSLVVTVGGVAAVATYGTAGHAGAATYVAADGRDVPLGRESGDSPALDGVISAPANALPLPTVTPLPPSKHDVATTTDGRSANEMEQTISVTILPGELSITPSMPVITFVPSSDPTRFTGTLSGVRVVDARGSLTGWTVTIRLAGHQDIRGTVTVHPATPTVVAGDVADVVRAGSPARVTEHGSAVVAAAAAGGGGGTYSLQFEVSVKFSQALTSAPAPLRLEVIVR